QPPLIVETGHQRMLHQRRPRDQFHAKALGHAQRGQRVLGSRRERQPRGKDNGQHKRRSESAKQHRCTSTGPRGMNGNYSFGFSSVLFSSVLFSAASEAAAFASAFFFASARVSAARSLPATSASRSLISASSRLGERPTFTTCTNPSLPTITVCGMASA